jgi:outer membrane lipoprotein-sorting protein
LNTEHRIRTFVQKLALFTSKRNGIAQTFPLFGITMLLMGCTCCGGVNPPASQFPNGQAAIDRMKETYSCARGVHGEAKVDTFTKKGRVRVGVQMFALEPELVRIDATSPFGAVLSTLTSNGKKFALLDFKEKKFLHGPSSACNLARLIQVPVSGHALVSLLHGTAPVLVHEPKAVTLNWNSKGYYVVEIPSQRDAREVLHLGMPKEDMGKPWNQQRIRVLDVQVIQQGYVLYHAELEQHKMATMAVPQVDEDGVEDPIPTSGPECHVEIPTKIHVEVPGTAQDVLFTYKDIKTNPPYPQGVFEQTSPGGVEVIPLGECD